jgi:recombination protein RecA
MSQALRKLAGVINKAHTSVVFINQLREKVGVIYGNPEVTTGGRALKFYSSMRFDVRRVETIKQGDQMLGNRVRVKIVKNKVAPPFKQAEFDIMYGEGISKAGDLMDSAVELGIIDKAGSWYSFQGNRIGQGRENVKRYLLENEDVLNKVEGLVLDTLIKDKDEEPSQTAEKEEMLLVDEDGVILD